MKYLIVNVYHPPSETLLKAKVPRFGLNTRSIYSLVQFDHDLINRKTIQHPSTYLFVVVYYTLYGPMLYYLVS